MVKVITNDDGKVIGVSMTFYSEPVPQGRVRFSTRGKFVRAFDPPKSSEYKEHLKSAAQEVYKEQPGFKPFDTAIVLHLHIFRSIPKTFSKKKHELALMGLLRPTTKPDCSNYLKGVEDALNKVLWEDDSRIVSENVNKFYSDQPRIELTVWSL